MFLLSARAPQLLQQLPELTAPALCQRRSVARNTHRCAAISACARADSSAACCGTECAVAIFTTHVSYARKKVPSTNQADQHKQYEPTDRIHCSLSGIRMLSPHVLSVSAQYIG